MWKGEVHQIGIAPAESGKIELQERVELVAGQGIVGDRYFKHAATTPNSHEPNKEITLIELEAIEALRRDHSIELSPIDARRNIVTQGAPLNHLVNVDFYVGEAQLRGLELCEPCSTLEGMTQKGIIGGLVHRGGLRAQILTGGVVQIGDVVKPID